MREESFGFGHQANPNEHCSNKNITLKRILEYNGHPVLGEPGPLVLEYLERSNQTLFNALKEHPRTLAVRFDLRLPDESYDSRVISKFVDSLKAKIRHNVTISRKNAHPTAVRYIWTKEYGTSHKPHYHVVLFLNRDTYSSIGDFKLGNNNLYNRINEAWASALGLHRDDCIGLVHIPDNHCYHVYREDRESIGNLFKRISYLCKSATKRYINHQRVFGCSRR